MCVCVYTRVHAGSELTPCPQLSNKNLVDSACLAPSALRSDEGAGVIACSGGDALKAARSVGGMRTCCFLLRWRGENL